ncbi:MAG: hypothetical protein V4656_05465 [Pseudomonadota bacterium]
MGPGRRIALIAGAAAVTTVAAPIAMAQQKVTGPVATYWMSAQTQTGFGIPGAGGAPDTSAMMRAMMGGGGAGAASKSLMLQLGSGQTAPAPAADHLPPQGLQAGQALPLLTPRVVAPVRETPEAYVPEQYQKPRGRMLIFWGCGERAKPGQPVVIDFAQLTAGRMPAGMAAFKGIDYRPMQPPAAGRNRTYGEWPNERTQTSVPSNGSLVGAHTVRGNYSPQIDFTLAEDQDFLGALNLTTNQKAPGGWANLGWNLVGNAQAYLATAIGAGDGETMVMWTSSESQAAAFAMPDYLSQSDITRLVASKALMGPATRSCQVPKEVIDVAPQAMLQLVAYGGEANFVHPPRPSDPRAAWNQQWAVKVRYRSATGGLLGMDMNEMMGGGRNTAQPGSDRPGPQQRPPRRPSAADILRGGILGGGLPFPR